MTDETDLIERYVHVVEAGNRHVRTMCEHGVLTPEVCTICRTRARAFAALDRHEDWVASGRILIEDLHDSGEGLHALVRQFEAECAECMDLDAELSEADSGYRAQWD